MSFTGEEIERYKRHLVLREVGGAGQQKLKAARVLLIGAGGLGSPLLLYLAAAGVGTIGIVDDDTVSLSNLQRQIAHDTAHVGRLKVESARDSAQRVNPHVQIDVHVTRIDADNANRVCAHAGLIAHLQRRGAATVGRPVAGGARVILLLDICSKDSFNDE